MPNMPDSLNVLVVDDEPLAQELVCGYVKRVDFFNLVGTCSTAAEAEVSLAKDHVDVMFIDIQMPGVSGLSFVQSLNEDERPEVVFTTAYSEYAVDGFKVNAVDYLLKPFDFDEFMRAANRAKNKIDALRGAEKEALPAGDENFFFVKSDYKLVRIEYENVVYVEGLKDYVKIYTTDRPRPILTLSTLKQLEERLEPHGFARVHRSFIVNVKMISSVEKGGLFLGSIRVPIGDGYKSKVQAILDRLTL